VPSVTVANVYLIATLM